MKHGRGFSWAELREAGLTPQFAQSVGIAVDHRRHNKNAEYQAANVARLTQYKAKLLLFPRHAGAPKKGLINDTTADAATAVQNTESGVFAVPTVSPRVKPAVLTDAGRNFRAYHALRLARINKRYAGKRAKALKDAEAAKK